MADAEADYLAALNGGRSEQEHGCNALMDQVRLNVGRGEQYREDEDIALRPLDAALRLIAFYLPQFHPIAQNDQWWGKGFTEWTNVTKAMPQFAGHYQPHLPGELGFYDLRMPETLARQAALARRYGLHGFCIYHYWFGGQTLLDAPLRLLLEHTEIDLPFCLCWANENWTRRWDGEENDILLAQSHSPQDDLAFARSLEPAFADRRYIRIDGRPLLVVYRPGLLPNPVATARRWRQHFARAGLGDPYLVMAQGFGDADPHLFGFDAAVEFPPHKLAVNAPTLNDVMRVFDPAYQGLIYDYRHMAQHAASALPVPYTLFPGVCPSWDNEARKPGRGSSFAHSNPTHYQAWLEQACRRAAMAANPSERLVFVNAWNEWAEGAHLEPDRHFGYAYLQATARALNGYAATNVSPAQVAGLVFVSHDAHWGGAQMLAIRLIEIFTKRFGVRVRVLVGEAGALLGRFRELAPTEVIGGWQGRSQDWSAAAKRLAEQGFAHALCNTVVSAQAIEPLRSAGLHCVSLVHELPSLMKQFDLRAAAHELAAYADAVVFPSAYVRDSFLAFAGRLSAREVIRPQGLYLTTAPQSEWGALRAEARTRLGIPAVAPVVLNVANGDLRKGVDLWPIIMRAVLERQPDAWFVWVGQVEPDLLAWMRHDLEVTGHAGRLVLPGLVTELRPFYAMADVFLLTSREDPFPSVLLDAMAHALPVVAFDRAGGFADTVRAGGGVLAPYLDTAAMADAVCRLLGSDDERRVIGEASRNVIESEFDFADYGFSLLQLGDATLRRVSVVVPNYNYAGFLAERLHSIWSQTYPIFEVIVLDDASTDNSLALVDRLQRQGGRQVRVVANAANSGSVSRQWARGVEMARGDVVWIAEADDFADPGFLAATIGAFDDAGTVISFCQSRQIDEAGRVMAESYLDYVADIDPQRWRQDYCRPGPEEIADALAVKNTIPNVSAALFRRDTLAEVLRSHLDEMTGLHNAGDWLCYLRLLTKGSVRFVASSLNNHRRHGRSTTLASVDQRHIDEIAAMQRLASEIVPVSLERQQAAQQWLQHVSAAFSIDVAAGAPPAVAEAGPVVLRDTWLDVVCAAYEGRSAGLPRMMLPGFPPDEMQIATTGQAGRATLQEAYAFYMDCVDSFARFGRPIGRDDRLLDFGIGWGRIARFFLNEIAPDNLYGLDVDLDLIEICRRDFRAGQFLVCDPWPPSNLPAGHFSHIVGYSVFSHLSEAACRAWMQEFHRLLAPGGMVALTTRGRWFFDHCEFLRAHAGEGGYAAALGALFPDIEAVKRRYDSGEIVCATSAGVAGGSVRNESFYGETFIPPEFAATAFLPGMELVEFQFQPPRQTHPIMFFRRAG